MKHAFGRTTAGQSGTTRGPVALIVDDHPLFCETLLATFRAILNEDAVEFATTLAEALQRLKRRPAPDLVLLDLKLPDNDALGGLIQLAKAAPGVPIIVVSALHASVLQIGVSGFAPKCSLGSVFVDAIERLWAGDGSDQEGYVQPGFGGRSSLDDRDAVDLLKSLTPQQARILELVCEGKFNKQIAYSLDISETTVKAHLTAILRKLNVQSRTQAALIAQNARFASISRSPEAERHRDQAGSGTDQ